MTRRRVSGRAWSIDRLSALSVPVSPMQRTVMEPSFWKSRTAKPKRCRPSIRDSTLFLAEGNRGNVVLPFQLKFAGVALGSDRILQVFDGH